MPSAPLAAQPMPVENADPHSASDAPPIFQAALLTGGTHLEGIGGWLILVAIGLAVGPFSCLHGLYIDLRVLYLSQYQIAFAGRSGLLLLVLFEAATNTIFVIALVALNLLFYRKRKLFPGGMIVYLSGHLVLVLSDHLGAMHYNVHTSAVDVVRGTVSAAIWIPYFLVSERVKATFVR